MACIQMGPPSTDKVDKMFKFKLSLSLVSFKCTQSVKSDKTDRRQTKLVVVFDKVDKITVVQ